MYNKEMKQYFKIWSEHIVIRFLKMKNICPTENELPVGAED